MSDWTLLYLCCGLGYSISATHHICRRMNDKTDSAKSELQEIVGDSDFPFWVCWLLTAFAFVLIFAGSTLIWPYLIARKIPKEKTMTEQQQITTRSSLEAEIDLNQRLLKVGSDCWAALREKGIVNAGQSIADSIRMLPHVDAQAAEIARLTAERDGLKQDAERYRWLEAEAEENIVELRGWAYGSKAALDLAIDAAIAKESGK